MTIDATFLTMLSGAVTGLAGVVGFLWKQIYASQKKTEEKLEHCESSHKETQATLLVMSRDLGELKGKQEGISELANQVLTVISGLKDGTE